MMCIELNTAILPAMLLTAFGIGLCVVGLKTEILTTFFLIFGTICICFGIAMYKSNSYSEITDCECCEKQSCCEPKNCCKPYRPRKCCPQSPYCQPSEKSSTPEQPMLYRF